MRFGGLIAAIILAAVAAVIVLRMSASEQAQNTAAAGATQPLATTDIYVAAQPIPVGTTITAEMVTVQPWPAHLVLDGFVQSAGEQKVEGMVARAAFQQQEPILLSKLSNVNDPNFLAGALPKGMRVISIQTNEIEGVAGFVFPGDYVDVILTHEISKFVTLPGEKDLSEQKDNVSETLITNVKVLAVDQRASGDGATDENGRLIIPRSVSLMVSPTDAQRLRLAQQNGTLTLALRSLADRESADPLLATTDRDISQFPGPDATTATPSLNNDNVVVVRGITRSQEKPNEDTVPPAIIPAPGIAPTGVPTPQVAP